MALTGLGFCMTLLGVLICISWNSSFVISATNMDWSSHRTKHKSSQTKVVCAWRHAKGYPCIGVLGTLDPHFLHSMHYIRQILCSYVPKGLFFIIPCMDSYTKVDLRTVSFDVPPQEVGTKSSALLSAIKLTEKSCWGKIVHTLLEPRETISVQTPRVLQIFVCLSNHPRTLPILWSPRGDIK